jgi:FkbM family methyltransferase
MTRRERAAAFVRPLADRVPYVGVLYRLARDTAFARSPPRRTPFGFAFAGPRAMREGRFEPEETRVVSSLLDECDRFVNVGANCGYYCCHALQRGKPTVAFEPVSQNVRCLLRNLSANGWERDAEVFPLALADGSSVLRMYGSGTGASLIAGWGGARPELSRLVPASTLDRVIGSRFAGERLLVLIDVEGAELSVLRGGGAVLSRQPSPVWMVEISVTEHQPHRARLNPHLAETFEMFWDRGYDAWTAARRPRRISRDEVFAIARGGADVLGTHNFVFTAAGRDLNPPG